MNEIQRFAIPAFLALLLHGILANFTLHKQPLLIPKQKGIPISVNINSMPPAVLPEFLPAEKVEITPEPVQPEVIVEQTKPEPVQSEATVEQIEPEPLQPEAIVEQIRHPSIPTIGPSQRKRIVTPDEIKQNPVPQNVSAIKNREEEPLSESEKNEQNRNVSPRALMDDLVVEQRPKEQDSAALLDQKAIPAYRQNEQPHYPVMAKRRGYQGEVVLHVLVDSRGIVSQIEIKATSGHGILDKTALATVKRWQFFPATIGGKPVAMWVDVPIDFRLQ